MEKHIYPLKAIYPGSMLYPAEGRVDVAGGVEEEQRDAYSTHHNAASSQRAEAARKPRQAGEGQNMFVSLSDFNGEALPPVEGRVDVARDVEEERRRAYTAHHI